MMPAFQREVVDIIIETEYNYIIDSSFANRHKHSPRRLRTAESDCRELLSCLPAIVTTGERGWPSIIWMANNVLKSIGPPFQIEASMSENSHTQFQLVKRRLSVDAAGAVRRRATRVWHRACAACRVVATNAYSSYR